MNERRPHRLLFGALAVAAVAQVACDPQVGPDYKGEPLATLQGDVSGTTASTNASVAVLWFSASEELGCSGPGLSCSAGGASGPNEDFSCLDSCALSTGLTCDEENLMEWVDCVEACGGEASYETSWELCADTAIGEMVPVTGQFPTAFQLDLFQPPPANALLPSEDSPDVAFGFFVAVDPDAGPVELSADADGPPEGILGGSDTHVLIYSDGEITADSPWGQILGGAYGPGYHVLDVIDGGKECFGDPQSPGYDPIDACGHNPDGLKPAADDLQTEIGLKLGSFGEIDWPAVG